MATTVKTMEGGFTPGPWSICVDDSGDRPVAVPSIQAPKELDCAIVHWDGFWQKHWQSARGHKEMLANARLISAAPELLEALQALMPTNVNIHHPGLVDHKHLPCDVSLGELRQADAAIKKALGAQK